MHSVHQKQCIATEISASCACRLTKRDQMVFNTGKSHLCEDMRQYSSMSGAGHSPSVLLSQGDMDLLRSSVMDLSHSLRLHGEQQHTPTDQAADSVARIPSHPIQSMATARPSSADSCHTSAHRVSSNWGPCVSPPLQPCHASNCKIQRTCHIELDCSYTCKRACCCQTGI
jgi:hypothetical protein